MSEFPTTFDAIAERVTKRSKMLPEDIARQPYWPLMQGLITEIVRLDERCYGRVSKESLARNRDRVTLPHVKQVVADIMAREEKQQDTRVVAVMNEVLEPLDQRLTALENLFARFETRAAKNAEDRPKLREVLEVVATEIRPDFQPGGIYLVRWLEQRGWLR